MDVYIVMVGKQFNDDKITVDIFHIALELEDLLLVIGKKPSVHVCILPILVSYSDILASVLNRNVYNRAIHTT